jgi:hypothetical protein
LGGWFVIVIALCGRSYTCLALCSHTDNDPKAENHRRVCVQNDAQEPHAHQSLRPLLINLIPTRAQLLRNIPINIEKIFDLDAETLVLRVGKAEETSFDALRAVVATRFNQNLVPNLVLPPRAQVVHQEAGRPGEVQIAQTHPPRRDKIPEYLFGTEKRRDHDRCHKH